MKKIMIVAVAVACALSVFGEGSVTYSKDAVTKVSILKMLSEKYNATLDADGNTLVVVSDRRILVVQDQENEVVTFVWAAAAEEYARADKLKLCHDYNRDKRLLRFYLDDDGNFMADYCLTYVGGMNSENFVASLDWFCGVLDEFITATQQLKKLEQKQEQQQEQKQQQKQEQKQEQKQQQKQEAKQK